MRNIHGLVTLFYASWLLVQSGAAAAGDFTVEPFRVEMGPRQKSGIFTVTNTGSGSLSFQVKIAEWTQDPEGKDVYSSSADIVFYPRILTLKGGERQIIRVGANKPLVAKEKAYRLFIEEMPAPPAAEKQRSAQVTVRISFAPPLFVRPAKIQEQGAIEKATLEQGTIRVFMRNTGNVHIRINTISVRASDGEGKEVFSKRMDGWYLLNGTSRVFEAPVPSAACASIASVDVIAEGDRVTLRDKRDVGSDAGRCSVR